MWLYLCLIATLISGLSNVAMKRTTQKNNTKDITILGLFYCHIVALIFSIIGLPSLLTSFSIEIIINILPLIITQTIGFFCFVSSIKYCDASTTSAIISIRTIIPIMLGIFILNETINSALIIISIIIVTLTFLIQKVDNPKIKNKKNNKKGIALAYGFVLFNGVSSFLNKIYIDQYNNPFIISYYFAIFMIASIIIYCIITKKYKLIQIKKIKDKKWFITYSFMDASSSLINRFSLIAGPLSIVSLITSCSIIVTAVASKLFLKEKLSKKKILIIISISICLFIIALLK